MSLTFDINPVGQSVLRMKPKKQETLDEMITRLRGRFTDEEIILFLVVGMRVERITQRGM